MKHIKTFWHVFKWTVVVELSHLLLIDRQVRFSTVPLICLIMWKIDNFVFLASKYSIVSEAKNAQLILLEKPQIK